LFLPAPERLRKIIDETSSRMNIPYQEILLIRSSFPQAYAVPGKGTLLFTARLLEICSDEEIAAICAHELAHLTESRPARYSRLVRSLSYMPWIFFRPLLALYGIGAFLGLLAITVTVPRIYGSISCKLESRADSMAKTHEGDEGTYARALTRLYEDRLIPAVGPKRNATHPDLYDRLAAAGITPDFPRPLPPGKMAWHGRVFGIIAGLLFGIFAVRFMQSFNSLN
jgi:Zn-dependent protease with chaperone function